MTDIVTVLKACGKHALADITRFYSIGSIGFNESTKVYYFCQVFVILATDPQTLGRLNRGLSEVLSIHFILVLQCIYSKAIYRVFA